MPQARLRVDLPEGPWIADVSRQHPETIFEVLTALPEEGQGFGLLRFRSDTVESVLEGIRAHETIEEVSMIQQTERTATIQIVTSRPMILLAAKRSGIPIEMPVEIQNGTAIVDVSAGHDRLSTLGEQFDAMGISFQIEYIQQRLHPNQLLTDRQQELLSLAASMGYYDTPRECTLTELAEEIGLAKSTCSETLHRAEEVVMKKFVEELLPHSDLDFESAQ
ncbi:MAG: putative DNA binding protein [Natronomonas sp.]|jgi:predicted DNA binding protein|uniref:helix-turn-helix domain-containing protein n=1 Tax=Natronomonas sp. TaxID=2184060 RepID=UPI0039896273